MRPVAPLLALLLGLCGPLAWAAPTATSPVVPEAVQGVALSAVSDPEAASGSLRMALAPGGQMLAASNGAAAWLYLREARRRFAVTPVGGRRDRHDMGAVASIEGLRWGLDGRLYVWRACSMAPSRSTRLIAAARWGRCCGSPSAGRMKTMPWLTATQSPIRTTPTISTPTHATSSGARTSGTAAWR